MARHRSARRQRLRTAATAASLATGIGVLLYAGAGSASGATGPRVDLTSPSSSTVSGVVRLSATASAPRGVRVVDFLIDGRVIASDRSSPYTVQGESGRIGDGQHTLVARVTDAAGAVASTSRMITVTNANQLPPSSSPTATGWLLPRGGAFGTSSVWKKDVRSAPVASNSATQVRDIASSVSGNYNGVAGFNVWDYNTTVAVVGPGQHRSRVHWDDCQHKGSLPGGVYGTNGQFENVPLPDTATPAAGSDSEVSVYSPSSDQLWEFWVAKKRSDGWHACWGGRIDHVSSSPGFFTHGFGATATGLPYAGGMVSIADARSGHIDHAVALQVIDTADWWKISYPAQRGDGSGNGPIREGTRFRLDPRVDVSSLHLNPYAAMVARAAQRYGFIVVDKGGAVAVPAESGRAVAANGGTDPWRAMLGSTPSYDVLRGFPWSRLQALPTDWGKPAN